MQNILLNNNDYATVPILPIVKSDWPSNILGRIQHTKKVKILSDPEIHHIGCHPQMELLTPANLINTYKQAIVSKKSSLRHGEERKRTETMKMSKSIRLPDVSTTVIIWRLLQYNMTAHRSNALSSYNKKQAVSIDVFLHIVSKKKKQSSIFVQ
jgi:hypothetical protein